MALRWVYVTPFRRAHWVFSLPQYFSLLVILHFICLNIYLFSSSRHLSLGAHIYTLQVCHTFVKQRSHRYHLAGVDKQSDWLFNYSSLPLPMRYCLSPFQRIDILFPLVANFPPHILFLGTYLSCGPPGKPQQKSLVPFTQLWKRLVEFGFSNSCFHNERVVAKRENIQCQSWLVTGCN